MGDIRTKIVDCITKAQLVNNVSTCQWLHKLQIIFKYYINRKLNIGEELDELVGVYSLDSME